MPQTGKGPLFSKTNRIQPQPIQQQYSEEQIIPISSSSRTSIRNSFEKKLREAKTRLKPPKKSSINECSICLQELDDKDNLFTTSCNHTFHRSCIVQLKIDKCPLCRHEGILLNILFETIYSHTLHNDENNKRQIMELIEKVYKEYLEFIKEYNQSVFISDVLEDVKIKIKIIARVINTYTHSTNNNIHELLLLEINKILK
jgi:hypothetical protein